MAQGPSPAEPEAAAQVVPEAAETVEPKAADNQTRLH